MLHQINTELSNFLKYFLMLIKENKTKCKHQTACETVKKLLSKSMRYLRSVDSMGQFLTLILLTWRIR